MIRISKETIWFWALRWCLNFFIILGCCWCWSGFLCGFSAIVPGRLTMQEVWISRCLLLWCNQTWIKRNASKNWILWWKKMRNFYLKIGVIQLLGNSCYSNYLFTLVLPWANDIDLIHKIVPLVAECCFQLNDYMCIHVHWYSISIMCLAVCIVSWRQLSNVNVIFEQKRRKLMENH